MTQRMTCARGGGVRLGVPRREVGTPSERRRNGSSVRKGHECARIAYAGARTNEAHAAMTAILSAGIGSRSGLFVASGLLAGGVLDNSCACARDHDSALMCIRAGDSGGRRGAHYKCGGAEVQPHARACPDAL